MKLCDYGCGQEAKFPFKNGKWCCSDHHGGCPEMRKKMSKSMKGKVGLQASWNKGKKTGPRSEKTKRKLSKSHMGKTLSVEHKKSIKESTKFTLKDYKEKHPFLFVVEELRETKNGKIQVHCKNHNCENSKEKGGWFIPSSIQLTHRINAIETPKGLGESNFYCSQYCKDTCILYRRRSDPYKENNKPYTSTELKIFNKLILKRDSEICHFCGEYATIVHHLRPQKLEPFFALDPDYAISVCKKCHYEKGHSPGSKYSTGNLAKIICSVESQKFLNQKIGDA